MPFRQRPLCLLRPLWRLQPQAVSGAATCRPARLLAQRTFTSRGAKRLCPAKPSSIFEELFPGETREPDKAKEDATEVETPAGPPRDADAAPSWLPNEDGEWPALEGDDITEGATAEQAATDTTKKKTAAEPTVLVLSGATASLLPSDFFRIAPQPPHDGQHVDGWAAAGGGLYKIVQDRDPATLAPRGRYFLYFGAPAAALAYAQEVRDLHGLARRAVRPPGHRNPTRFREEAGSLGQVAGSGSSNEEMEALRSFSLLPPSGRLDLVMTLPDGALGKSPENTGQSGLPDWLRYDEDDADAADAQTRVMLALADTGTNEGSEGNAGTTVAGLRQLIAADGVTRNLPWAMATDGLNDVAPVPWLVAEQKRQQEEEEEKQKQKQEKAERHTIRPRWKKHSVSLQPARVPTLQTKTAAMYDRASFTRFVLTFADVIEARRFVRGWHRRTVQLPAATRADSERMAIVDATVMW